MGKVYIIAEAGVNHNGELETAKALIDAAESAGADAVKFQTFHADQLVCRDAEKAEYQKENTDMAQTQYDMLKRLEMSVKMHTELIAYCAEKKIQFLSAAFDAESVRLLTELGIPAFKIPSGEITNGPYLKQVAQAHKDIFLSTGMSSMEEIREAVWVLKKHGAGKITILHCNSQYPTPMEDVNLRAMTAISDELNAAVGYSDHTLGMEVSLAAVALGASVIEKHLTLDRGMEGPDHKASMEPQEFKRMVGCIRNIEKAMGKAEKTVSPSEKDNRTVVRKSIVAARDIKKGEVFTEENLTVKRPGTGLSPMKWDEVLGGISDREYRMDERICWNKSEI